MIEERKQRSERRKRMYSKLFWVLLACGVAYSLKDWAIGLVHARERGTLGAVLLRTGIRSVPLIAVIGLSFYLRRFRSPIDRVLSKGRIFTFMHEFAILFLAAAAIGFLDRSFWSWGFLLVMPIGASAAHAIFAEPPRNASSDSASEPKLVQ